ncbi:glutamate racemase [Psychromonas sp. psych-6C06]|uniref:glutamate racemase n=1 Tax=Psychromonas sp. psych-6C06 TaxID=2058089 RepID=UPI001EE741FA|nr:glutamate racemase [Psychromonas sp. psych-6C06]
MQQLLIFDSGVGGLSIFQEVIQQSPNVSCYYLSDNAYFPYGELDEQTLITRLTGLLDAFVKSHPVDMIVIACNSASTVALSSLRAHFCIPVVGVVPAIKPASLISQNNIIGLVATPATIERTYTRALIDEFASDKEVLKLGSTLLVKLAENKLTGKEVEQEALAAVFAPWLTLNPQPDTLVLGCTHFPLLKDEIARCFENGVNLVDSGEAIAKRVATLLPPFKSERLTTAVSYQAFYTLQDRQQLLLKSAFLNLGFESFLLYQYA